MVAITGFTPANSRQVCVYDLEKKELLHRLEEPSDLVREARLAPDGTTATVGTGYYTNTSNPVVEHFRIWSPLDNKVVLRDKLGGANGVTHVAYSSDSRHVFLVGPRTCEVRAY